MRLITTVSLAVAFTAGLAVSPLAQRLLSTSPR
jgi:hypothetical protein